VGLNSWQSEGASPPPDTAPGLREVEFELGESKAVDELERRLEDASGMASASRGHDGALWVRDPDGQLLTFNSR
jgi:catechol-2,3-dioxygenase